MCRSAAEHFLIPAFVFFFDMLFPFGAVNDSGNKKHRNRPQHQLNAPPPGAHQRLTPRQRAGKQQSLGNSDPRASSYKDCRQLKHAVRGHEAP